MVKKTNKKNHTKKPFYGYSKFDHFLSVSQTLGNILLGKEDREVCTLYLSFDSMISVCNLMRAYLFPSWTSSGKFSIACKSHSHDKKCYKSVVKIWVCSPSCIHKRAPLSCMAFWWRPFWMTMLTSHWPCTISKTTSPPSPFSAPSFWVSACPFRYSIITTVTIPPSHHSWTGIKSHTSFGCNYHCKWTLTILTALCCSPSHRPPHF